MCLYTVVQQCIGNSTGDAQLEVAAENRDKTDGCMTPAEIVEAKSPAGDRHWNMKGRSRLIEEFTWYG